LGVVWELFVVLCRLFVVLSNYLKNIKFSEEMPFEVKL